MGLENCAQLSTIRSVATKSSSRSNNIKVPIISYREKCNLPTFQGLKRPFTCLSSSVVSSKLFSGSRTCHKFSIVCNASKAASEGTVQEVNAKSWDTLVLGSKTPVLVEFWAPWCGPCKMIASVIDELAKEYSGKIECYKINTDECPTIATQYNIRSIPTVLVFKNGEKRDSVIGAVPKTTLTTTIDKYLAA